MKCPKISESKLKQAHKDKEKRENTSNFLRGSQFVLLSSTPLSLLVGYDFSFTMANHLYNLQTTN